MREDFFSCIVKIFHIGFVSYFVNYVLTLQSANGLGMQAVSGRDQCEVSLKFPSDTIPKWVGSRPGCFEVKCIISSVHFLCSLLSLTLFH